MEQVSFYSPYRGKHHFSFTSRTIIIIIITCAILFIDAPHMSIVILPAFLALYSSTHFSHFCIYYPHLVVYVTVAFPRSSIQAGLKSSLYIRFAEIHTLVSAFFSTLLYLLSTICSVSCWSRTLLVLIQSSGDCVLLVEMVP